MMTGQLEITQMDPLAVTSGTAPFVLGHLPSGPIAIVVEDVSMTGAWVLVLDANPAPAHNRRGPRQNVVDSLQRSLDEHADIWAELSKH